MTTRAWRGMLVIAGAILFLAGLASFVYLRPVPRPLLCAGDQVSAYGSAGTFYIPGYHPPPELGSPSACLGGVRQALAAGLRPAPPPAGGKLVGDAFYLVPASQDLRQGCKQAATLLHFAVPCPDLIPMHWAPVTCPPALVNGCAHGSHGPERLDTFQLMQGDMIVPDTFVGNGKKTLYGRGNLIVNAGPLSSPIWGYWNNCVGPSGSPQSGPSLGGHSSTWETCPTELDFFGHTLLRWSRDGLTYSVGLDGAEAITRQVVQVVAEHLHYVAA